MKYKSLWHNRTDDMSPSVWRVWIEIDEGKTKAMTIDGHPPCGGCGLKSQIYRGYARGLWSPSVWRVWIEIDTRCCPRCRSGRHPPCGGCGLKSPATPRKGGGGTVTLRVEGVD